MAVVATGGCAPAFTDLSLPRSARVNDVKFRARRRSEEPGVSLDQTTDTVWWMQGNYAPITDELTVTDLPVQGTIPAELSGSYVRNGFNPPGAVPFHWFFGAGMVHGFDLRDGRVSYRNRYVRTPYLEHDLDLMSAMGDLRASPANTNIVRHAGRLLALEEAHLPWELDTALETVDSVDFDGRLTTPMTAHPKICPITGEMLFFGYQFLSEPYLTYHRVDAAGQLVQSEVIDIPRPVMMHDFTVTEHYAIFFDLPIVFALEHGGFKFDRDAGARIGVMPRTGTNAEVTWYEVEPCTVFHALNSYERGDEIVVQVCRADSIMAGGMDDLGDQATLWEWTIDTTRGTVAEVQLDDRNGDFPRIDDRRVGLPARYGYVAGLVPGPSPMFSSEIFRYDLEAGTSAVHSFGEGARVFEPVFAPAGPDAAEDEGWILVLSHDDPSATTTLNVLDAQDFTAPPVARVALPQRVPFGAHGNWMPDGI
jgi:carotenoid cleavage dioxygenase-like enzyme